MYLWKNYFNIFSSSINLICIDFWNKVKKKKQIKRFLSVLKIILGEYGGKL